MMKLDIGAIGGAGAATAPKARPKARVVHVAPEVLANNYLSGLPTQFGNGFDGIMNASTGPFKTLVKSALSSGRTPEAKTYASEAALGAMGMFDGVTKFIKFAGRRAKSNGPGQFKESAADSARKVGMDVNTMSTQKLDTANRAWTAEAFGLEPGAFLGKAVSFIGSAINTPGSALNFVDLGLKQVTYNRVQWEQAQNLVKQGKQPTHADALLFVGQDKELMKKAVDEAEYFTYTGNPNMPAMKWIVSKETDKIPGMRFIVPFRRAIANIFEQGIEHSPWVLMSPTLRKNLLAKDSAVADAARTKLVFGTTLITTLAYLGKDNLVGPAPKGSKESAAYRQANGGADALVFEDGSIPFKYMGPYGTIMKQIAIVNQYNSNLRPGQLSEAGTKEMIKDYSGLTMEVLESFVDGTWGANIIEFSSAFTDATRSGSVKPLRDYFTRIGISTIPVVGSRGVQDFLTRGDDYKRRKDTPKDVLTAAGKNSVDLELTPAWDFTPQLQTKMYSDQSKIREIYGDKPDPLGKMMAEMRVDFGAFAETVPVENPNFPGNKPERVGVERVDREFMMQLGQGSKDSDFPGVREFLAGPLKSDLFLSYKRKYDTAKKAGNVEDTARWSGYIKIYVEEYYSEYMGMLLKRAKGNMAPGALGDRIARMTAAQGRAMKNTSNELRSIK